MGSAKLEQQELTLVAGVDSLGFYQLDGVCGSKEVSLRFGN